MTEEKIGRGERLLVYVSGVVMLLLILTFIGMIVGYVVRMEMMG